MYAALVAAGLLGGLGSAAHAGGVSLSLSMPGLAVHANPAGTAIAVGQPGFYGELSVGNLPEPPPVVYAQPVIITAEPEYVGPPMYLHVPPGYERHWAEHCHEYRACARRVYFVRDDWYNNVYVPRYRHEAPRYYADHDRDHFDRDHFDRDHFDRDHFDRDHYERDHFDRDRERHWDHEAHDHDRGEHRGHDDHDRGDDHDHGHDRD
jgi:hypothetical protein